MLMEMLLLPIRVHICSCAVVRNTSDCFQGSNSAHPFSSGCFEALRSRPLFALLDAHTEYIEFSSTPMARHTKSSPRVRLQPLGMSV